MRRRAVPADAVGVRFRFGRSRPVPGPARLWVLARIDELVVITRGPQTLDVPGERVTTRDGGSIVVGAHVRLHVTAPLDAATKVVDYREALSQIVRAVLHKLFREGPVEDEQVRSLVDASVAEWGIRVDGVALERQVV